MRRGTTHHSGEHVKQVTRVLGRSSNHFALASKLRNSHLYHSLTPYLADTALSLSLYCSANKMLPANCRIFISSPFLGFNVSQASYLCQEISPSLRQPRVGIGPTRRGAWLDRSATLQLLSAGPVGQVIPPFRKTLHCKALNVDSLLIFP